MVTDWESTFRQWSKPSSDTEQEKQENAERMIRDAIDKSIALTHRTIQVFAQGSYRNNTNVRQDSDVDVCVRCMDVFFYHLPDDLSAEQAQIYDATYTYHQFKNEVEEALVAKFGRSEVTRGNKAFDVHENTYRVDADVVACFEHRRYTGITATGQPLFVLPTGAELRPDNGGRVINWPHQNCDNGVEKNKATGGRFKNITRVVKRLRNHMADNGIAAAKPIPSYLIECLIWNVPNARFGHDQYTADVREALAHTFNETIKYETCSEWGEVNELKYLFRTSQPWTRSQAHAFLSAAWDYIGFE